MKTLVCCVIVAIFLVIGINNSAVSQEAGNFKVGISANVGKEFFKIKNEDFIRGNSFTRAKSSDITLGGGVWLEKFLSNRFSLLPRIDYHFIKVSDHVLVGSIAAIPGLIKESSHSVAMSVNARYYIPLSHGFRLFADAGIKGDKMLYFRFQQGHIVSVHSLPNYYGFVNPGLTAGLGLSKARWGVSVNYENYLVRSKSMLINSDTGILLENRTVSRQNMLVKLTYTIWQGKK